MLSAANNGKKVHSIQANLNSIVSGGAQFAKSLTPVTSLLFSKNSEFLCAGLGDGVVKVWNLQNKKNTANLIQPTVGRQDTQMSPLTAISLNCNNQILASSNQRGVINLYKTEQIFDPIDTLQLQAP